MNAVLLVPYANETTDGLFTPLIDAGKELTIKPIAWKDGDPPSHRGYEVNVPEGQFTRFTEMACQRGYALLVMVESLERTLDRVGLRSIDDETE